MRTRLLIATKDSGYSAHLAGVIAEKHADVIDVSVCGEPDQLTVQSGKPIYDAALLDGEFIWRVSPQLVRLPLLLVPDEADGERLPEGCKVIGKYQRISSLVANVLELCAKSSAVKAGVGLKRARVIAVWSPAGGVGKTTAALAYCERQRGFGKQVLYLNMETFSSTGVYFNGAGMSISGIFDMLESGEGDLTMMIKSAQQRCGSSGISYFLRPDNFDDMNVITPENTAALIDACAAAAEELVIDMSSVCDGRTAKIFECSDRIFLVTDSSAAAHVKLSQFTSQHDVFDRTREKITLVLNKGSERAEIPVGSAVRLPFVRSADPYVVFQTLSSVSFDM